MKVEKARVSDLKAYEHNAKRHTPKQIKEIADSIEAFGFNDPIAVWHNGDGEPEIVEGHGRMMALKMLGWEECPVIVLDHLSDTQRRAYTHIHNQLALESGIDIDALQRELAELEFDMGDWFDVASFEPVSSRAEELGREDCFDVLFVCHTEEEEERLKKFLGVKELKSRYDYSEVF